jgi:hypothetical protein
MFVDYFSVTQPPLLAVVHEGEFALPVIHTLFCDLATVQVSADYFGAPSSVYTSRRGRTAAGSVAGGGAWPVGGAPGIAMPGGSANGGATAPGAGGAPVPPIKAMYCLPSSWYVMGGPMPPV